MANSKYDQIDFQRDISNKALERASNGKYYYEVNEIIDVLKTIYTNSNDWPLAESTIKRKIGEIRKKMKK